MRPAGGSLVSLALETIVELEAAVFARLRPEMAAACTVGALGAD